MAVFIPTNPILAKKDSTVYCLVNYANLVLSGYYTFYWLLDISKLQHLAGHLIGLKWPSLLQLSKNVYCLHLQVRIFANEDILLPAIPSDLAWAIQCHYLERSSRWCRRERRSVILQPATEGTIEQEGGGWFSSPISSPTNDKNATIALVLTGTLRFWKQTITTWYAAPCSYSDPLFPSIHPRSSIRRSASYLTKKGNNTFSMPIPKWMCDCLCMWRSVLVCLQNTMWTRTQSIKPINLPSKYRFCSS